MKNIVSDMLKVGRSTLREAYTALAVFGFIKRSKRVLLSMKLIIL